MHNVLHNGILAFKSLINQQGLLILWRKEHLVSLGRTPIVYLGTKAKFHWQTL
jgi:hypothetical protein